jgi:hypothetical protein
MRSSVRLYLSPILALALGGCSLFTGSGGGPEDTFNGSSSLDRYTIHNTPQAWFVDDGMLYADTAARQSVVIRKSAQIADGWVETATDLATDGGLVLRFQSSGNHYLLALRDDSQFFYANVEMYRAVGGQFVTIAGPVNIDWSPGTRRTVRFEAEGSALKGYVDGVQVLQATDLAYITGGFGLRHDNTRQWPDVVSRFDVLRWGTIER